MTRMILMACMGWALSGQAGQGGLYGGLSPEDLNVLKAENYFQLAREAKRQRNYEEASTHLNRILELSFPATQDAQHLLGGSHLLLAEIRYSQGQPKPAAASAEAALAKCQARPCLIMAEAYKLLARISQDAGNEAEARSYSTRAMKVIDELSAQK